MKIYANTDNTSTILDEYVGKDVWLRVEPTMNFSREYIRILTLNTFPGGYAVIRYNHIPIDTDLDLYKLDSRELYSDMTTVYTDIYYVDRINDSVIKNVIPTEDLLWGKDIPVEGIEQVLSRDDGRLDRFIGKDVWVVAIYLPSGKPKYVNFCEKFGNTVDYFAIDKSIVDRLFDHEDVYISDSAVINSLKGVQWCRKHSLINSWQISYPIELLTAEELNEILDNAEYGGGV